MIADETYVPGDYDLSPTRNKKPSVQMYLSMHKPDPINYPSLSVKCIFVRVIHYPSKGKNQICQGIVAINVPGLKNQVAAIAARLALRLNENNGANMSDTEIAMNAMNAFEDLRGHLGEDDMSYIAQS